MAQALSEEVAEKVVRQVEFYFSESNLPRDRFLKSRIYESEDELVSLALVCSFQRMKVHLGLKGVVKPHSVPSETVAAVAESLRKSSVLKVSDDGTKVGRIGALQELEKIKEQVDARTIAVSPLAYDVTMEDVEKFFNQHGKVNSVRLPRHVVTNKCFCGTALVEFSSHEEVKAIEQVNVIFDGADLTLQSKKEFDSERRAIFDEMKADQTEFHVKKFEQKFSEEDDGYVKGIILVFTLSKPEVSTDKDKEEKLIETSNASDKDDKPQQETSHGEPEKNPEIAEREQINDIAWYDIKKVLEPYGAVRYIIYAKGENSGYVRFENLDGAQKARTAAVLAEEGGLKINDYILSLEVAEGKALRDYGEKDNEKRRGSNYYNRGRGGRGRGGKHYSNKPDSFSSDNKSYSGKKRSLDEAAGEEKQDQ